MSLCICVGRLARAFAARIHKVELRLRAKFVRTLAPLNHHERLNNAFARPNIYL